MNNYFIYKASSNTRELSIDEFKLFTYSGYLLINKSEIKIKTDIDKWIIWFKINDIGYRFITKILPDFNFLINKIEIK